MIQSFLLPINKLNDFEKEAVFSLFQTHFEGVTW